MHGWIDPWVDRSIEIYVCMKTTLIEPIDVQASRTRGIKNKQTNSKANRAERIVGVDSIYIYIYKRCGKGPQKRRQSSKSRCRLRHEGSRDAGQPVTPRRPRPGPSRWFGCVEWGVESIEIEMSGWMYWRARGLAWLPGQSVDKQGGPASFDRGCLVSMRAHRERAGVRAFTITKDLKT